MSEPGGVRAFVAHVRSTIVRRSLLKGGETVVVAVSGGPDSLALLHGLARLASGFDLRLHVAHFDHRLRGGSAADAAFVGRVAATLGLPATVRAADANDVPPGRSPEEIARERRYAFLDEVADAVGAARIATGHTLNDQAETTLMRVLAGTGVHGLGGIPPERGRVIRPLIDIRRAQTEAFCRALRLRARRDPTNADTAFVRNAVRAELLPLLVERFNVRTPEALARLADLARDEDALLDELAAAALEPEVVPGGARIDVENLLALPVALQRRVVRRCAALDAEHTERVLRLARDGNTGDEVVLPARLNARLSYGSLLIGRAPSEPVSAEPVTLVLPGVTDLPSWSMRMRAWIETRPPTGLPDGRGVCVLDADRARGPLVVRRPRAGDRFRPLGMTRARKLGDFFTDAKVPREDRALAGLVTSGGSIAWVVGHRPDDRFKVTASTRRFLWLATEEGSTGGRAE